MNFGGSLEKIVIFLLVLGVVIVFHELGHFLAAKILGVKVDVFSFGVGRRLFGFRFGDTDYRVCLIPLGGYVRMAGEASADPDSPPRPPVPGDFEEKGTPAKLAIMLAGPVFNFILAIALLAGAYVVGIEVPAYLAEPARVGTVEPGSPAEQAGILPGDLVVAIGGRPVDRWEVLVEAVLVSPGSDAVVDLERGGRRLSVPVRIESRTKHAIGWLGIAPCYRVLARSVTADTPAGRAGVKAGDEIVLVGGEPPCTPLALVARVQDAAGAPLELLLRRGDEAGRGASERRVVVAAAWDSGRGLWLMGIRPQEAMTVQRFGIGRALSESVATNWRQSGMLVEVVGKLFTGRLSVRAMSGPMELADIAEDAAATGLVSMLTLMALISLNLGVFNLVPIPILDGGRIFILLVEALRGRELERRTKEWILTAGLAMIVVLMVAVLYFDFVKKFAG